MNKDNIITYLNGEFLQHKEARVSVDDRSVQFADSIYEIALIYNGVLIDQKNHIDRLYNSASMIGINLEKIGADINDIANSVVEKNAVIHGSLYIQISRGVAKRWHIARSDTTPSVIATVKHLPQPDNFIPEASKTTAMLHPDIRWKLRNIKSNALMATIKAKYDADSKGFDDVLFVNEHGNVTEGSASNIFIVTAQDKLLTHPADADILHGTVRHRILQLVKDYHIDCQEGFITPEELYKAKEVFATGSIAIIRPISKVNEHIFNDGKIGHMTDKVYNMYLTFLKQFNA